MSGTVRMATIWPAYAPACWSILTEAPPSSDAAAVIARNYTGEPLH